MTLEYTETVWNAYRIDVDMDMFYGKYGEDESFESVLKNQFDGNIWKMAEQCNFITTPEYAEKCYEHIDTDFSSLSFR